MRERESFSSSSSSSSTASTATTRRASYQSLQHCCVNVGKLSERLASVGDPFDSGDKLIDKWGYITNANGTVPYTS